jgi:hypothetical protein
MMVPKMTADQILISLRCIQFIQFTHQQKHFLLNLEKFKMYIKIQTKCRSYMFPSTTIIREVVLSLTKFILKHSVKYFVIYYVVVWQHVLE